MTMKHKTLIPALAIACAASLAAAGPRPHAFLHPHSGAYSLKHPRAILLQTPREGVLQNRLPYQSGVRSFTATEGSNEFDTSSPLPYGAPIQAAGELVIVRPREAVPSIAISPWEPITDRTIEELRRNYPALRRTSSIEQDLRIAQNQYLRERGYIASVRGFRSSNADQPARSSSRPVRITQPASVSAPGNPQLVITESDAESSRSLATERLKSDSIIRVRSSSDQAD